jgi:hypothetical protein
MHTSGVHVVRPYVSHEMVATPLCSPAAGMRHMYETEPPRVRAQAHPSVVQERLLYGPPRRKLHSSCRLAAAMILTWAHTGCRPPSRKRTLLRQKWDAKALTRHPPHVAYLRKTCRDGGDTKGTLGGEGVLRRPDSWRKAVTYLADASDDSSTANTTRSALASIHSPCHSRTCRRPAASAWPTRGLDLRTLDRTLARSAKG